MKTKSLLRREEYKALSCLSIDGAILDVGGSQKSGYHELIKGDHRITTGNIDAAYGVDVVFDAEESWPATDASYDGVLLVNVLEHLYKYENALRESARVLKSGGVVAGVVPFMFNVHGSPHDYFRYTRATLERKLSEAGYTNIEIHELGSGAFSVIYHCLLGIMRWYWLATLLIPVFTGLDKLVWLIKPGNKMSAKYMPLGYFFKASRV